MCSAASADRRNRTTSHQLLPAQCSSLAGANNLHVLVLLQEVPRCVLQLLAVGCILLASKDLEVAAPSVEQLCAVTANHFQVRKQSTCASCSSSTAVEHPGPGSHMHVHYSAAGCCLDGYHAAPSSDLRLASAQGPAAAVTCAM